MRNLHFYKKAQKFLQTLPPKQRKQVFEKIVSLQSDVRPNDIKKLHGNDFYRVDSGEYRIVYDWDEALVYIRVVGKRSDGEVYRKIR